MQHPRTFLIRLRKLRCWLQRHDGHGELRHWVGAGREGLQHGQHVTWKLGPALQVSGQALYLAGSGYVAGKEQP